MNYRIAGMLAGLIGLIGGVGCVLSDFAPLSPAMFILGIIGYGVLEIAQMMSTFLNSETTITVSSNSGEK